MCASSRSRVRFWAPNDVADLWQHALNVCRLLEVGAVDASPLEDWECVARMIASFLHTWDVSGDPKWRRDHRIFERDGWRCRVPGCSSRQSLQVHHVIYRSHGGGNEDDNLAVLCATHHLQGIHAGRLRCRGSCEGHLRWEFGVGHGGAPIMTTVEEVILKPGEMDASEADHCSTPTEEADTGHRRPGQAAC
ncbi:MAG TPA: HNH endonuclease signature motif containing protein [Candidatus Polarisedimenticolia bacterium]|nr:HNH endonuclease signature motif containing protein [Candidatus Polarisedimenticolia bacterium]